MAPPPSTAVPPLAALVVRILTFICLIISVIILATNTIKASDGVNEAKLKFNHFYAYRYMLSTAVLGIAYTLIQSAFAIFHVSMGNRIGGDGLVQIEFYGDKIVSYILATGAAAGFGLSVDLNSLPVNGSDIEDFLNKANAAASLLFIGFLFSATSSVFSSLSLPKRS
ncbi:CASP PIMP1 [Olea europaea subsp. europaea]|uniref:CASP-like protein n=1 Tax=Olea europaea subsp. europaea TaxID=158383 RepID=A0A8S0TFL5_OLEEU|nr:CASP PIMP1 [Olea europaea subsp. europaea]